MKSNLTNGEVPLGLGMALAQNTEAMRAFSNLSAEHRKIIINKAHEMNSKEEMQELVSSISRNDTIL